MTLIPILALVGVELVLRIAGYGYATDFFVKTKTGGRTVFVENDRFGFRFFPPGMARSPSPTTFPAEKNTNVFRVFILGESAALGDPEPAFGFGRYLEVLLRERFPTTQFEVISAAMTAINSHALLPVAAECARHNGDLWIIYMGNNEVVGPFGAGTVLGPRTPPLAFIRASLAVKRLRLGQWLDALTDRIVGTRSSPKSWQGMKMFLDSQVRHDDPRRKLTDEHFRENLEDILRTAQRSGVKIVLSTVAGNLKDNSPFASLHSPGMTEASRASWEQLFREGIALETSGNWSDAIRKYSDAAALDAEFAELQFRLGRCHLKLNQQAEARRCFELARDFDALQFRTDSRLNAIIRQSAEKFAGVTLLDASEALAQTSPLRITGQEVFYEHVHLNFEGNYQLARAAAERVVAHLPTSVATLGHGEWASRETCERRLCVTPWDRARVYQNVLLREAEPPFTLQFDHAERVKALSDALAQIKSGINAAAREPAREMYREALARTPGDFMLHGNYAKFLEDTGDNAGALTAWQRVEELLPYHFGPPYYRGKLLARMARHDEAELALRKTLHRRPDAVEAMDELGQVLVKQEKTGEALARYADALKLQPNNARLHFHKAEALAAEKKRDEALASLRQAIELRSDYWEARYFLGVELARNGQIAQAREQFSEVVRLKPNHVLGHLNLGVALAKEHRLAEAVIQFRETLRLDPKNQAASEYLSKLESLPMPKTP